MEQASNDRLLDILDAVSVAFCEEGIEVTSDMMLTKTRKRSVSMPRQVCMFMLKEYMRNLTYQEIGRQMNGLNHATIIHGERVAINEIENNYTVGRAYSKACDMLGYRVPDWIHVCDRLPKPSFKPKLPIKRKDSVVVNGEYKEMTWTPEQKKMLKEWRKGGEK